MRTTMTDLLGCELPIMQAPMAGAGGPELAAAVSTAGGFGCLPMIGQPPEALRQGVAATRALTDRRFAVNLNVAFAHDELLAACIGEGVFAVSLFWGVAPRTIEAAKRGGLVVLSSVGTAAEAAEAVSAGADAIVAQGWEAGGHVWGEVASMALVPAVADAVGDVPVIAAGGIADGRGLAAALMLGAASACIGTRLLVSEEATIHPVYRDRLLAAAEDGTAWSHDLYDGDWPEAPHRALRNSTHAAWCAAGRPAPGARPDEGRILGHRPTGEPVRRYQSYTPRPGTEGEVEAMSLWAGQGTFGLREVQPAARIVEAIAEEATRLLVEGPPARRPA